VSERVPRQAADDRASVPRASTRSLTLAAPLQPFIAFGGPQAHVHSLTVAPLVHQQLPCRRIAVPDIGDGPPFAAVLPINDDVLACVVDYLTGTNFQRD